MKRLELCRTLLIGLLMTLAGHAFGQTIPQAPFKQCPAVGLDTGCYILLWIDSTGSLRVLTDPKASATYDGSDDTLVGVQNDSTNAISSIPLQGPNDIFGFDGDGICSSSISPNPPGCPFADPNQYGGPGVTFSSINSAQTAGIVNFSPAIPAGGKAYFGLENAIQTQCNALTLPSPQLYQDIPVATVGSITLGPAAWSKHTIGEFGCYVTDLATEVNYFAQKQGVGFRTAPDLLNTFLASKGGFFDCAPTGSSGLPCVDLSKQPKLIHDYAKTNGIILYDNGGQVGRNDFAIDQYACQGYPPMLWVGAIGKQPAHHWLVASGQATVASVATYSIKDPYSYTTAGSPPNPYLGTSGYTLASPSWNNSYSGYQLFSDTTQVPGGLYVTAGGFFNWLTTTLSSLLSGGAVYDIVVTAPDGTKVGYNAQTSTSYQSIGGASYRTNQISDPAQGSTGTPTAAAKFVSIPEAVTGSYKIEIFGTGTGTYGLNMVSYDTAGNYTEFPLTGTVTAGSYESRTFSYTNVPKTAGTLALSNLTQTYTGSALAPTVTTTPIGLSTSVYYSDQSGNPIASPTTAGIYTAVASISSPNYTGTTSSTFTITKAAATISLGNLSQPYSGSTIVPTVTTSPTGLSSLLSYSGSSTAPSLPGTYNVAASISDPNYTGSATGTLTITYAFTATSSGASSTTISKGATATYMLSLAPPAGTTFPFEVNFAVTGLPAGATPSFSPTKVTTGSGATTVTVSVATISTIAANTTHNDGALTRALAAFLLLPIAGLSVFGRRRYRKLHRSLLALMLACTSLGLAACSGTPQTPTTYSFNVVATSGSAQQTVPLTLVVK